MQLQLFFLILISLGIIFCNDAWHTGKSIHSMAMGNISVFIMKIILFVKFKNKDNTIVLI